MQKPIKFMINFRVIWVDKLHNNKDMNKSWIFPGETFVFITVLLHAQADTNAITETSSSLPLN